MRKDSIKNTSTEVILDTPEALGTFLRVARRAAGLTQAEAAGLCNVGTRFLNEIEHGKSTAALGKVMQVLRGYGIRLHGTWRCGSVSVKES
jgi:HTH-type transcriptional regulator/antitoxin HipB